MATDQRWWFESNALFARRVRAVAHGERACEEAQELLDRIEAERRQRVASDVEAPPDERHLRLVAVDGKAV